MISNLLNASSHLATPYMDPFLESRADALVDDHVPREMDSGEPVIRGIEDGGELPLTPLHTGTGYRRPYHLCFVPTLVPWCTVHSIIDEVINVTSLRVANSTIARDQEPFNDVPTAASILVAIWTRYPAQRMRQDDHLYETSTSDDDSVEDEYEDIEEEEDVDEGEEDDVPATISETLDLTRDHYYCCTNLCTHNAKKSCNFCQPYEFGNYSLPMCRCDCLAFQYDVTWTVLGQCHFPNENVFLRIRTFIENKIDGNSLGVSISTALALANLGFGLDRTNDSTFWYLRCSRCYAKIQLALHFFGQSRRKFLRYVNRLHGTTNPYCSFVKHPFACKEITARAQQEYHNRFVELTTISYTHDRRSCTLHK